ncbi:MAG: rhamnosyltransferase WsaF family glycosyltransferase [Ferrovibrionaceae bacterium]
MLKHTARLLFNRIAPRLAPHFAPFVPRQDAYVHDARALADVMDLLPEDLAAPQQQPELAGRLSPPVCAWYIPPLDNVAYGGARTIVRCAAHLRRTLGMRQRFLICGQGDAAALRQSIVSVFPDLADVEVDTLDSIAKLQAIPDATVSIATLWTTAFTLARVRNSAFKYYFIQDYEPLFYPAGTISALVEATYRFGYRAITNTDQLAAIYRRDFGGEAISFMPAIEPSVFHAPVPDNRRGSDRIRVFSYARPGHPRNAFELLAATLRRVKARHGDRVELLCAGAGWNPAEHGLEGIVTNLNMLSYAGTGDLYRSCHIGLTLMMTRHPSYLPFELMASGCLLVTNHNPVSGFLLRDGENCLLAPPIASVLAAKVGEAIERYDDFAPLRQGAIDTIGGEHGDWETQMRKVSDHFRGILNL